jgi:negative regulator of sigma E activity
MKARRTVCESVQDDLKAFLDGELGWLRRRRVGRHLRECGECGRVLDELRGVSESIRSAEEIEASPDLEKRVLAQLKEEGKMVPTTAVTARKKRLRVWFAAAGAVGVAAVLCAAIIPVLYKAHEGPIGPTAATGMSTTGTATLEKKAPILAQAGKEAAHLSSSEKGREQTNTDSTVERTARVVPSDAGEAGWTAGNAKLQAKKESPATKDLERLNVTAGKEGALGYERQVIRTGAVSLEVKDAQRTLDQITAIVTSLGGFVQDSSVTNGEKGAPGGSATIRVPSVSFDEAIRRLSALGKLLDKSTKGEDVTAKLVDLEARIRNLRSEEQQYLKILTKARRVAEILSVECELERIRGDIEEADGQKAYLAKRVELSTIVVAFSEKEEKKLAPSGWNIGSTMKASGLAFLSFAEGLSRALVWIVVFSPVWFPILLLFRYLYRVASGPAAASGAGK